MHTTRIRWCLNCTRNAALEWKKKKKMQFEFFYLAWLSDPLLIFGQPPFLSGTPHSELFCSFWQERESWWSAAMGSSSSPCPFASAFQRITKEKGLFFFPGVSTPFLKHDFFPTHFSFLKSGQRKIEWKRPSNLDLSAFLFELFNLWLHLWSATLSKSS